MRKIVLDIETSNTFQDVGSNDPSKLSLSLMVVYDYASDAYLTFTQKNISELWPIIEQTDLIIWYNSDHIDLPLLNKYYPGDLTTVGSLDLMTEIKNIVGRSLKLDNIAHATLGVGKSGHGLQAIEWWKNGEIEKVEKYCRDDVKVTKDVYEYALTNGVLKYKNLLDTVTFSIDTSAWNQRSAQAMNYTLPL